MDTLRAITQCSVCNGQSTFWLDRWVLPEPLATIFPAIFSHHQEQHALVGYILQVGVRHALRNRLTTASKLSTLLPLLQGLQLTINSDSRTMLDDKPFSTRAAYSYLHKPDSESDWDVICSAWAPKKVKIFTWLVMLDRLNSRENLHRKFIVDSDDCPECPGVSEDYNHLFC
jgi:hypothetical protein